MGAIIHTISATTFATDLTDEQRTAFLADIAAEWVDAGEDGSIAMPTSYALLFERRVAQAAKMAEADAAAKMTEVLSLATTLAEEGDLAFAYGPRWAVLAINAVDDDDETDEQDDDPVEVAAEVEPTTFAEAVEAVLAGANPEATADALVANATPQEETSALDILAQIGQVLQDA